MQHVNTYIYKTGLDKHKDKRADFFSAFNSAILIKILLNHA